MPFVALVELVSIFCRLLVFTFWFASELTLTRLRGLALGPLLAVLAVLGLRLVLVLVLGLLRLARG